MQLLFVSLTVVLEYLNRLLDFQVEQATPDVPLPGLKQKGKEAAAIGKGGASGPGAKDQVRFPC